jgi:hypothetical protein
MVGPQHLRVLTSEATALHSEVTLTTSSTTLGQVRALCGENLVTLRSNFRANKTLELHRVVGRAQYKLLDVPVLTQDAPPDVTFFRRKRASYRGPNLKLQPPNPEQEMQEEENVTFFRRK